MRRSRRTGRRSGRKEVTRLFVDANLFLRYLTNDVPEQADAVEKLLDQAEAGEVALVTNNFVMAELGWVLSPFYKLEPPTLSTSAALQGFRHANSELRRYPTTTAGLYISRPEVDQVLAWLMTDPPSNDPDSVGVVLDQPGAGKTVVMRQVLSRLEAQDIPVVAIKADFLSGVTSRAALSEHLNLPGDFVACVQEVAKKSPVVVLVDQVDLHSTRITSEVARLNYAHWRDYVSQVEAGSSF